MKQDVLNKIPTHKTAPNILKQPRPEQIFVPNFNNQKQKVAVIHGFKNKLSINPLATKDGKMVDMSHKIGSVPSKITLTPLSGNTIIPGTGIGKANYGKLNTPKLMTPIPAAPKTNAVPIIPKIIDLSTPKKVDAALASPTASLLLKSKDNVTDSSVQRPIKRIHPIKISDTVTMRASSIEKSSDSDMMSHDSVSTANDETVTAVSNQTNTKSPTKRPPPPQGSTEKSVPPKRAAKSVPLNADYQNLIDACKAADSSPDMPKVIEKLQRYYRRAPSEYVNSNAFRKLVNDVAYHVQTKPDIMFHKLIDLISELKTRKTEVNGGDGEVAAPVEVAEAATPPVDPKEREKEEKRVKKIKEMSDALQKLQARIRKYEQAEVDWNDEGNSNYLITERLKERAYNIYKKLCEHTGESRNVDQSVRKTIKCSNYTPHREFNKKLQVFVNESGKFPDMFDVIRIIDHCNTKYGYRLTKEERRDVGEFFLFYEFSYVPINVIF